MKRTTKKTQTPVQQIGDVWGIVQIADGVESLWDCATDRESVAKSNLKYFRRTAPGGTVLEIAHFQRVGLTST